MDLIIRNAKIYDGTGSVPYLADIGIIQDKVSVIGSLKDAEAGRIIDAAGMAVLPGFIDSHTHSDVALFNKPNREEVLLQGVTSEVISACGIGCVPLSEKKEEYIDTVKAIMGKPDREIDCSSLDAYMKELGKVGTGTNVAVMLAHSPLRVEAAGFGDVPLEGKELEKFLSLTEEAFFQGACGFSTGLAYYPASFSDTEEIIKVGEVAQKYDLPLCFHQRTALREDVKDFDPKEEVLQIAKFGARVHYSHYRTTPATAGSICELLEPIERGLSEGFRVTADFYPYPVGSGYLPVLLPFGIMNSNVDGILEQLTDPKEGRRIREAFWKKAETFSDAVVTEVDHNLEFLGKSFRQIAEETGKTICDTMYDLMIQERLNVGYRLGVQFDAASLERLELDFIELIKKPYYMIGSDTLPLNKHPHPRTYGAFARMLSIARKHGVGLELLANRMCANPAALFKLKGRGQIKEGNFADIIIFDEDTFCDRSTFENPKERAQGMQYVIINGKVALDKGVITGTLAGKPLKSNRWEE